MCATPKGGQVAKALPAGAAMGGRRRCLGVEKQRHMDGLMMRFCGALGVDSDVL